MPLEATAQQSEQLLQRLRELAQQIPLGPAVGLGIGALLLGAGLLLAGFRFGRVFALLAAGTLGVLLGRAVGSVLNVSTTIAMIATGTVFAIVGLLVYRMVTGLFCAVLFAAIAFAAYADRNLGTELGQLIEHQLNYRSEYQAQPAPQAEPLAAQRPLPAGNLTAMADRWELLRSDLSPLWHQHWKGIVGSTGGGFALGVAMGLFASTFAGILTTSILGAFLMFCGASALLAASSPQTLLRLRESPLQLGIAFAGLCVAGVFVQYLIEIRTRRARRSEEQKTEEKESSS